MKKLGKLLAISCLLVINACSAVTNTNLDIIQDQNVTAQSKSSLYPFDINKDFYPLYNSTNWKYDVYDSKSNKFITSVTKTLDVANESSLELDKKNNYYLVALKKSYSDPSIKDPETYEFIRRRNNQLAFGKLDDLTYYPEQKSKNGFNPLEFRPFVNFDSKKLETVKVKAGTFQCIKTEFTLKMDKYTIWYAKGVGEVKRLKEGYFNGFRYELSEHNNSAQQFVLTRELLSLNEVPAKIVEKVNTIKNDFIKLNELPSDVFTIKNTSIFVENRVVKDNNKKLFHITFTNKGLSSKDNINLIIDTSFEGSIMNVMIEGENNSTKATYKGKVIDKLPLIKR